MGGGILRRAWDLSCRPPSSHLWHSSTPSVVHLYLSHSHNPPKVCETFVHHTPITLNKGSVVHAHTTAPTRDVPKANDGAGAAAGTSGPGVGIGGSDCLSEGASHIRGGLGHGDKGVVLVLRRCITHTLSQTQRGDRARKAEGGAC